MKKHWSILVYNSKSPRPARPVRVARKAMVVGAVILALGAVGLGRLLFFATSYGIARFGVFQEQSENRILVNKVRFLKRFVAFEAKKVSELIAFEDAMRIQYGLNTISEDVRRAGVGGKPAPEDLVMESLQDLKVAEADSIRRNVTRLLRQVELQGTTLSRMATQVKRQHDVWQQRPSIWPARGKFTSGYGYRLDPIGGYLSFHAGIDVANAPWTPIFATADGHIRVAGNYLDYGNSVIIDHPLSGFRTMYSHMIKPAVVEGQFVRRGELIGYMGSTGKSTGNHLHYEVRRMQNLTNPADFILPDNALVD